MTIISSQEIAKKKKIISSVKIEPHEQGRSQEFLFEGAKLQH